MEYNEKVTALPKRNIIRSAKLFPWFLAKQRKKKKKIEKEVLVRCLSACWRCCSSVAFAILWFSFLFCSSFDVCFVLFFFFRFVFLSSAMFSLSISHFRKRSNCDDGEFTFAFNDTELATERNSFCTLEFVDHAGVLYEHQLVAAAEPVFWGMNERSVKTTVQWLFAVEVF